MNPFLRYLADKNSAHRHTPMTTRPCGLRRAGKKLEHIVYKRNRLKLHKYILYSQCYYAMMRNKIYTLSILIVPNSFIKNLSEAGGLILHRPSSSHGRLPALPMLWLKLPHPFPSPLLPPLPFLSLPSPPLLSHSRSFKVIRNEPMSRTCVSSY